MGKFNLPTGVKPKTEKKKTLVMTEESLQNYVEEFRKDWLGDALYVANCFYTAAFMLALRDNWGWGQKRLAKVMERTQYNFDAIMSKEINYYDICEMLREECGIRLVFERVDGTTVPADDIYREASGIQLRHIRLKR